VKAVGMELAPALGIAIPVGKDSMSMKTVWDDDGEDKSVTAPLSLIISAFSRVQDVRKTLTPQLRTDKGDTDLILVDLGKAVVSVSGGQSSYTVHLSDFIRKEKGGKTFWGHLGTSFLLNMFTGTSPEITVTTDKAPEGLSYYAKTVNNSTYLKIPYLIYFYLPLLLIMIMAFFNSPAILTSFFYYVGLFLLFDFRRDLFATPLSWLMDLLNLEIGGYTDLIGSLVVVTLFVLLGVLGLINWKKVREPFQERLTIMFFLLLPLFLRF